MTFSRQHPIPPDIADFACIALMLVVEVEGADHGTRRDARRDEAMRQAGWHVLQYWNNDVLANRDGVVADIVRVVRDLQAQR